MNQVAEDLRKAVEVLDAHGWCQAANRMPDGRVCTNGAVGVAIFGEQAFIGFIDRPGLEMDECHARMDAAMKALGRAVPEDWRMASGYIPGYVNMRAIYYNDDCRTTVEDVKLMFKRAIEAEEAKA